jgi:hypothetical protein
VFSTRAVRRVHLVVTAAFTLALLIAMQGAPIAEAPIVEAPVVEAPIVDAPALEPLAPESAPSNASPSDAQPPEMPQVTGTMGGVLGAASGCAIGMGAPTLVGGAGGGVLYWLYTGAAAGTILGWTPALAALGTSCGIGLSAMGLPLLGSSAAAIGAMIGAKNDGRDPMPALYGAVPGLALAGVSTALACTTAAIGCGGFAAAQPFIIVGLLAIGTGIAAPPCTACGAGITDLAWGNPDVVKPEDPIDAIDAIDANGTSASTKTAMRF